MNALKLLCAIALLAVAACQVSSPVELPQDQGLQPADGTCNPDVMPC
jgi:predicted small lipoprotein YifL